MHRQTVCCLLMLNVLFTTMHRQFSWGSRGLVPEFLSCHWSKPTSLGTLTHLIGSWPVHPAPPSALSLRMSVRCVFSSDRVSPAPKEVLKTRRESPNGATSMLRYWRRRQTSCYTRKDSQDFPQPGEPVLRGSVGPREARREQMEPAPAKAKPQGRLLVSTQLDAKDELEEVGRPGPGPRHNLIPGCTRSERFNRQEAAVWEHFAVWIQRDTMELWRRLAG